MRTLIGFLALSFSTAALASQFKPGTWYEALAKPSFNPPNWIFGPVWAVLYTLIAVAAWLVWRQGGQGRGRLMLLFGAQLALNAAWSWLFFGLQKPGVALIEIGLLVVVVGWMTFAFSRQRALAGALLVPYFLWVSFAMFLNAALYRLNP